MTTDIFSILRYVWFQVMDFEPSRSIWIEQAGNTTACTTANNRASENNNRAPVHASTSGRSVASGSPVVPYAPPLHRGYTPPASLPAASADTCRRSPRQSLIMRIQYGCCGPGVNQGADLATTIPGPFSSSIRGLPAIQKAHSSLPSGRIRDEHETGRNTLP